MHARSAALAVHLGLALMVAPARASTSDVVFQGMCDASGAVPLAGGRFLVADDEDNVLRVYDAQRGGPPLSAADLSPDLELPHKKKAPETDLEAATHLGDKALWLTSHGRNSKGKPQPSRLRFFATTIPEGGGSVRLVGKPYTHLLDDLLAAPALSRFGLRAAAEKAPKDPGGLNIEGMTARPDGGSVVIGFRNPLPEGKALVLPILNPLAVMDGERARLGSPQLVDLGGRGIRAISFWRGSYLLVGGSTGDEKRSQLYRWDGKSARPQPLERLALGDINPEGFASFPDRPRVLLLSDDGTRPVDGVECKKLKDPSRKSFRGRWVALP